MKKTAAMLVLSSGFLVAAGPAGAASDYLFLKLPGITGTSTVTGHLGDIEVLSFSAGVSAKKGTGSTCSDLNVMKITDQTSPLLFARTLFGIDFDHATLTYSQNSVSGVVDVYSITLNNVSITSVQDAGSTGAGQPPTEALSLHATSWVATFVPPTGPPVTTTVTCK